MGSRIPQQRIAARLDAYMESKDYTGAERHLKYWLEEARQEGDLRGELMVRNEMIGFFRKTGSRENAFGSIREALRLLEKAGYRDAISGGTTLVNAATAFHAFGENSRALELFEEARKIYSESEYTDSSLLGGLCNNMGLACAEAGQYGRAYSLFEEAMEHMARVKGGSLEQAVTLVNMAETVEKEKGMEQGENEINSLLDKALDLLEHTDAEKDGYYAYICERCAPSFEHFGYFAAAEEMYGAGQDRG